jgi:RND family efflux transporter MFP subunit
MKRVLLSLGVVLFVLAAQRVTSFAEKAAPKDGAEDGKGAVLEVTGRTRCTPGRKAILAPVPLHPVVEVLVVPGDRVKKGQELIKIDDDEPKADVRAKQAAWDNAKTTLVEATRYLTEVKQLYLAGSMPSKSYHEMKAAAIKAERDEKAAKAALDGSMAELEHYTVTAQIDGVVAWLDVYPGMVSRPGTTVWGEILDLSEVDVICDLTPDQVESVALGQAAEIRLGKKQEHVGTGRVVYISIQADKATGLLPVVVRVPNPKGRLRCEIPVQVRFTEASANK